MHLKFHQNVASMRFNRYMVECEYWNTAMKVHVMEF